MVGSLLWEVSKRLGKRYFARFEFKFSFYGISYIATNTEFQKVTGYSTRLYVVPKPLSLIPLCITITISRSEMGFFVNKNTDVNGVTECPI